MDAARCYHKNNASKKCKFTMYTYELVDRWFNEEELNNINPYVNIYTCK